MCDSFLFVFLNSQKIFYFLFVCLFLMFSLNPVVCATVMVRREKISDRRDLFMYLFNGSRAYRARERDEEFSEKQS